MGEEDEQEHWDNVMRTFLHYEEFVSFDLGRRQEHINKMCPAYADRLPQLTFDKFSGLMHASSSNQTIFEDMVDFQSSGGFQTNRGKNGARRTKSGPPIALSQQHRNIAVLHSLFREWSSEGEEERVSTFSLLTRELQRRLPVTAENALQQKVLVPGCGLGRLPLEVASLGYACQGNEFSAFMLIASNFMLNATSQVGEYRIYPWISSSQNIKFVQDSMQAVDVPDVCPVDLLGSFLPPPSQTSEQAEEDCERAQTCVPSPYEPVVAAKWRKKATYQQQSSTSQPFQSPPSFPRFSMAAGDFVQVYTNLRDPQFAAQQGRTCVDPATGIVFRDSSLAVDAGAAQWDAVVTCFFLDTAPVVCEYVEAIERILKPGGVWINLGPLLYHWATPADAEVDRSDPRYGQSVELSYEEVRTIIAGFGLQFLHEQWQDCTYSRCPSSMMWTTYRAVLFTVRKPVVLCRDCRASSGDK